jgi:hypothetical protein
MHNLQSKKSQPLQIIQKLISERYQKAKAIFWAGSVSKNSGTIASDLDLIIVYEKVQNAYREAFIYDNWPVDVFVHDIETLCYFFEESRIGNSIVGLAYMIFDGLEITIPTTFSEKIKKLAQEVLVAGPAKWDKHQLDKERFFITDTLEDIKFPMSKNAQIASAVWLYEALSRFYFRAQNKWCTSGKSIIHYLEKDNPIIAIEFINAFDKVFQKGEVNDLEKLVKKILAPYGGLLWDGFRSDASEKCRRPYTL